MLITIEEEPVGDSYKSLLRFAGEHSGSFSLVWRQQLHFDRATAVLEEALHPFLIEERVTDEWPGTKLVGHQAAVRFYRAAPEAIALLDQAGSLYAWLAPAWPEDLAFYTDARVPWLFTISHERDAAVDTSAINFDLFRKAVPGLRLGHGRAAG